MPFKDLPPLQLLPAFEAAGRLGSFKAAAREQHVTPSAVSQQLKALETALGVPLFERRAHGVVLTSEGQHYLEVVRHALADLASAGRRARRRMRRECLRLSTVDFFAYEFLLPRLSAFRTRFPGVELRLETSMEVLDFDQCEVDAAIRVGGGPWPSLSTLPVGRSSVAVVCSAQRARRVRSQAQLFDHTLIELRGQEHRGWHAMLAARGLPRSRVEVLTFDSYFETMLAAEQGLGMAFGLFPMTTHWVTSGRLAVPLAQRLALPGSISLVHRVNDRDAAFFADFAVWLSEQYAPLPSLAAGRIAPPRG